MSPATSTSANRLRACSGVNPAVVMAVVRYSATPVAAEPAPSSRIRWSRRVVRARLGGREHGRQGHRGRALDVVVEGQQPVAVPLENRPGVVDGEILPLQQDVGQLRLDRVDELVDERVVRGTGDPLVPPAEVPRVGEPLGIVGSDVQGHGQGPGRIDPADRGVEGKLADRDPHSADALVTDAEDPLAVGDDDDVDGAVRPVAQRLEHPVPLRVGQEESSRTPVDPAEHPARLRHRRRVDEGQDLRHVLDHEPVEQHFVRVLQVAQEDVPLQRRLDVLQRRVRTRHLLLERFHGQRKHAVQVQRAAFGVGVGGSLVP